MQHPSPDLYQPALGWRSHSWRIAVALVVGIGNWGTFAQDQWEAQRSLFWLDLGLGLLAFVLMHFRRRWPFATAIVVTLLGFFSALAAGPGLVVAVSLATRRRWPEIVTIGILGVIVGQGFVVVQPVSGEAWWFTLAVNIVVTVAILAVGMYIGSRRELLWTLHDRAERAEAEQELRVAQARSTERARIAREMHDVLAHRISLVSMHSGALVYRTDLSAEEVAATAEVIQGNAHQAMVDLRHVLGVLRGDTDEPSADRPQPTFRDVEELVEEATDSGMHVEFHSTVADAAGMPDQVGRTVYRIVQEGLTNARKHAPGARVTVTVAGGKENGIDVRLHNPLPFGPAPDLPASGLGIVGLTERAELAGGTLRQERDEHSFALHGWIPWQT